MSARRILILIVIGVAGYLLLAWLFPTLHPSAKLGFDLDRRNIINIARQYAQSLHPEAAEWPAGVETSIDKTAARYLEDNPRPEIARFISVISSRVEIPDSRTGRRFEITLGAHGRPIGAIRRGWTPDTTRSLTSDEQQSLAEAALKQIAAEEWSLFSFARTSTSDSKTKVFRWEMTTPGEDRVKLVANASVQNDLVTRTSIYPEFSRDYNSSIRGARPVQRVMDVASIMLLLLGILFALIVYFRNIIRTEVRHSSTLLALFVAFVIIEIWVINGSLFEDIYNDLAFRPQLQRFLAGTLLSVFLASLISLAFSLPLFVLWGAGYPEASWLPRNPLSRLELFIRGKLLSRKVGASILIGLALGWAGPVITLLAARLVRFGQPTHLALEGTFGDLFTARFPLLVRPLNSTGFKLYAVFVVFAFVLPFMLRRLRRSAICHAVAILVGSLCFLGSDEFETGIAAATAAALVTFVFLDRLVFRASLLSAVAALIAGDFAVKLFAMSNQPSPSLQRTAWIGWMVIGLGLVGSAAVALRGQILSDDDARARWFSEDRLENREDRERLKAQFQVARRAQEQMLPSAPPVVAGVQIAAVCLPAREVGGDLFDFLDLANGRVGIVVADVSGKGVPASLYMTLTKGLLASVAETTADPGEILREVNRHLYVACKRKMFVTLLLGVFDPELRTFVYARAGHNPPVWRKGNNGETRMLAARGIGLGLTSGEVFNRTLELEEIKLEPNDMLILYSDGISEAMNEAREEYGELRLRVVASRADGMSAEKAREFILDDVRAFLGRTPPQDDQTLVVVKVLN